MRRKLSRTRSTRRYRDNTGRTADVIRTKAEVALVALVTIAVVAACALVMRNGAVVLVLPFLLRALHTLIRWHQPPES